MENKTTKRKITNNKIKREMYLEIIGKQLNTEELYKIAEENFIKSFPDEKIKDVKLYINVLENKVYYVINGREEKSFNFDL